MKPLLRGILLTVILNFSLNSLGQGTSEDIEWIFSDYTYRRLGDYSLSFIRGAGVSKGSDFIIERFPTTEELEDTLFQWCVNDSKLRCGDYASLRWVKSREHYSNPFYDSKILPSLWYRDSCIFISKDSFLLSSPLKSRIRLNNDEYLYEGSEINYLTDKVKISLPPSKFDTSELIVVSVAFSVFGKPTIVESEDYETIVLSPGSQLMQGSTRIFRYLKVESDSEITIPISMFAQAPNKNVWVSVSKGAKRSFIIGNKTYTILTLDRESIRLVLVESE